MPCPACQVTPTCLVPSVNASPAPLAANEPHHTHQYLDGSPDNRQDRLDRRRESAGPRPINPYNEESTLFVVPLAAQHSIHKLLSGGYNSIDILKLST